ncbi:MAG: outer membrane protein assembly factor BamB family protein [Kiritimatiellia bacterium]
MTAALVRAALPTLVCFAPPTMATAAGGAEDPFAAVYTNYNPGFRFPDKMPDEERKLSTEPAFYTLNMIEESDRAYALVLAARQKEEEKQYREALEIYQKVLDEYPDALYRVSPFGIFVPVTLYCQLRMLKFPKEHLGFYRVKYDARAKEAYELALQNNSSEVLAEIRDRMLATSYGARALLSLGDMALDRGHYLEALEYFSTVAQHFAMDGVNTPELALKMEHCRRMLGDEVSSIPSSVAPSKLASGDLEILRKLVSTTSYQKPTGLVQRSSPQHVSADDYALMPPTTDPLGIREPVWEEPLPGARDDVYVYSHPVVTDNSVIYRFKNIVCCHSLLNGELRWMQDIGGRVRWQNWAERQYPQEDLLVQDGMVFTPLYKVGPTLVALDQTTGRIRWAYGPMVAAIEEETKMRFEAAPAGGPLTVYASYVLDNIEGETHIDTEYGVMAFESTTGRVRWRQPVCRLRPGKFSAGFAVARRNRIRSFTSPPLYHEGTLYYCSNAGAIAALDALSGRIKWLVRYPYFQELHDATRPFGDPRDGIASPMLWYNQRPLLMRDALFVTPVDAPTLFRIDRRSGKIVWSKPKGEGIRARRTDGGPAYFLGPTRTGELAVVYSFRKVEQNWAGPYEGGGVHLIDPESGKTVWESGDVIAPATHPVLKYSYGDGNIGFWAFGADRWNYATTARPFLSEDDQVIFGGYFYYGWPIYDYSSHLAVVSLKERKVVDERRYIGGRILAFCHHAITHADERIKVLEELPHKDNRVREELKWLKEIKDDSVPLNTYGAFLPFSRITFTRFGVPFELRMGPRKIAMLYDVEKVKAALAARTDPEGLFARAELAVAANRLEEAAALLQKCLAAVPSEDLDFRALINQQLYKVHKRLACSAVRSVRRDDELANCMGMSRTVSTLAEEIESRLALCEAFERRGEFIAAAQQAQSIVAVYSHHEYPTASLLAGDLNLLATTYGRVIEKGEQLVGASIYGKELVRGMDLMKKGLPLYLSALSPLRKDLTVRAGEIATAKLLKLKMESKSFGEQFEQNARKALAGGTLEERLAKLPEFPGTAAAQQTLERLLEETAGQARQQGLPLEEQSRLRRQRWLLADVARVCGLALPSAHARELTAPTARSQPAPIMGPLEQRKTSLEEARGTAWLLLERHDDGATEPNLLFLGGRVKKKLDTKFVLYCLNLATGEVVWKAQEQRGDTWFDEIRLKGKGEEAGFTEAFVCGDIVVVHGLYDVLAFNLKDGKLRWRYEVPFDFEIRAAVLSGDLLALAGQAETVMLYLPTADPRGEVVWQAREEGDLYIAPYFHGDRLVSVRKLPFNVTVRYRSTGRLMGRLALPDLLLFDEHPLVENGPRELPVAHENNLLIVSDGWYYIAVDIERMKIVWKRLIEANDMTRLPPLRFALGGEYLAVLKEDYDVKVLCMLSSRTGEMLWKTDPKDSKSPQPIYSMFIKDGRLYGIRPHPGQAFYLVAMDCVSGRELFKPNEQKAYEGTPEVRLHKTLYGETLVAMIRDRQDFEVKAFSAIDGRLLGALKVKATGDFGEHGRASAVAQNGHLLLLGGNELVTAFRR